MNEFNKRTAMNYHLRTGLDAQLQQDARDAAKQHRAARFRIVDRQITAAIRRHNRLIALDLSVIAICLLALGVLIGCAF